MDKNYNNKALKVAKSNNFANTNFVLPNNLLKAHRQSNILFPNYIEFVNVCEVAYVFNSTEHIENVVVTFLGGALFGMLI